MQGCVWCGVVWVGGCRCDVYARVRVVMWCGVVDIVCRYVCGVVGSCRCSMYAGMWVACLGEM